MRIALAGLVAGTVMIATPANTQQSDGAMESFSNRLCRSVERNYGYLEAGERAENVFLTQFDLTRENGEVNLAQELQSFWAEYGDEIICENASFVKPHIRTPQAFLKRIVDMNMEGQIFNGWLLDSEYPIDVNAVQWVDGEPETLLDYLNLIIADESRHEHYSMNEIMRLRHHLITNFGAMTAVDLELSSRGE